VKSSNNENIDEEEDQKAKAKPIAKPVERDKNPRTKDDSKKAD